MPTRKPIIIAEIGFTLNSASRNRFVIRQKLKLIEPLELPPPILPYDQSYSRSLNISTGDYQKLPLNSNFNENENSFGDNGPNLLVTNSFGNRRIRSPKLVRRDDLVQDYENSSPENIRNSGLNNSISPICARCFEGFSKKSSCVIS